MRKNFIRVFAAAALTLSFAACSQDDIAPNVITPEMATSYAKVNISMAGGTGTRAIDDASFENGEEAESAIKSLTLLLYSDEGALVGKGTAENVTLGSNNDDNGITSTGEKNSVVVQVTLKPGDALPTKMLAYINAGDVSYNSLDAAHAAIVESSGDAANGFVMTNALNSNFDEVAVSINAQTDLYESKGLAEADEVKPINIYVERLAAKIFVQENGDGLKEAPNFKLVGVDGKAYSLKFNAQKWAPTGTAPEMYSLKQKWSDNLGWAISKDHSYRNYWAQGVLYGNNYPSYIAEDRPLHYVSANEVIYTGSTASKSFDKTGNYMYVNEHTFGENAKNGDKGFAPKLTATNIIVVGQYEIESTDGGNVENFKSSRQDKEKEYDFYLALKEAAESGNTYWIYSKNDLIKYLIDGDFLVKDAEGTAFEAADYNDYFTLVKDETTGQYYLTINAEQTVYTKPHTDQAGTVITELTKVSNAKHYKFGYAYFFAPIEHNGGDVDLVGRYGVVRNHVYKLTVNKIESLGAPLDEGSIGDDPENTEPTPGGDEPGDKPIEPDPDEIKDVWINSTINVLSWHVVEQGVIL